MRFFEIVKEFLSSERKAEHIKVCLEHDVSSSLSPGWDDIHLSHKSLPEIDLEEIDLSVDFLGRHLNYPIVLSALTGGHPWSKDVNEVLGRVAQEFNIILELGSQRSLIEHPESLSTYTIAREKAPDAFIVANIGATQLLDQKHSLSMSLKQIEECIQAIRADAIAIHLNYLQEAVMLEGETRGKGCLEAISRLISSLSLPVIVKETGSGISGSEAKLLKDIGVAAIDLGGAGGTNMALVESHRSALHYSHQYEALGKAFASWGLPTVISLVQCKAASIPIMASGGIRDGVDMAKALVLGADLAGIAMPLLKASVKGFEETLDLIKVFIAQLTAASFLTGARNVEEMRGREYIITGKTREWIEQTGYSGFARPPEAVAALPISANLSREEIKLTAGKELQQKGKTRERKIRGTVLSGLGQGNYFTRLDWVVKQFKEKLGFDPYPGTLNLKLDKKNEEIYQEVLQEAGIEIVPPSSEFCVSKSYEVYLGSIKASIILPCVPNYPRDIVEIMAPVKLKEKLQVKDGDELEFTVKI